MRITDIIHSPLPTRGPWPQSYLDDIHLWLAQLGAGPMGNLLINPGPTIWQRGTNFTATGYTADRWRFTLGAGATATVTRTIFPTYRRPVLTLARSVSGAGACILAQRIEGAGVLEQRGGIPANFTLSFNVSAPLTVGPFNVNMVQNFGTGGAPSAPVTTVIATGITGTAGIVQLAGTVPSAGAKTFGTNDDSYLELQIEFPVSSGVNTWNLWDFDLRAGTAFGSFYAPPNDLVVAQCERYYCKTYPLAVDPGTINAPGEVSGRAAAANAIIGTLPWRFPSRMRALPIVTAYSTVTGAAARIRNGSTGADMTVNSFTDTSDATPGYMTLSAAPVATDLLLAHYTADAEL